MNNEQITITMPKIGDVVITAPPSMAVCFEFAALWSDDLDQSAHARLCAGALGVVLDSTARYPKYRPLQSTPMIYGYKVLEALLRDGATPNVIYSEGTKALICMAAVLPTNEEIDKKANFTNPHGVDTT